MANRTVRSKDIQNFSRGYLNFNSVILTILNSPNYKDKKGVPFKNSKYITGLYGFPFFNSELCILN